MQKAKKEMQEQTSAKQNFGVNELSGGELEQTSGGQANISESYDGDWDLCIGRGLQNVIRFGKGNDEKIIAQKWATRINDSIASGKFHDMRD